MIIDWEHHWSPEKLWRERGGRPGEYVQVMVDGSPSVTLSEQTYRLDMHLRDMDQSGIDIAVLSFGSGGSLENCKFINDSLSQVIQQYPRRFVGLASVPPLGGKKAFAELERAIKVLGLKGVIIGPPAELLSLDAPQLRPFYEKVIELDIPVFVHGFGDGRLGYDALDGPYDLHRMIGREFDAVNAIVRLACSGVLDDSPRLKLVMRHLGGGISALVEKIEWWQQGREPIPEIKLPKKPFREYFNMLYYDTAHGFKRGLKFALTILDSNHLLFATDYPNIDRRLDTMKPYIDAVRALDIDEEAKEGILGRNAAKLLKLPII